MRKSVSLKGKRCFTEVFQKGKRFRVKGFQCALIRDCGVARAESFCFHKTATCSFKIGIIISRRFGNACERNRAKRQVRAMVDTLESELSGNWCMAIRIFDDVKEMSFENELLFFQDMFKKAGIIREEQ